MLASCIGKMLHVYNHLFIMSASSVDSKEPRPEYAVCFKHWLFDCLPKYVNLNLNLDFMNAPFVAFVLESQSSM